MDLHIKKARRDEHPVLTEISFAAKKYWNYPPEYFEIWKEELTISEDYIEKNSVFTADIDGRIAGYYSVTYNPEDFYAGEVFVAKGYWLEHIFLRPEFIGKGIGRRLISHCKKEASGRGIKKLFIFSDPYSRGFYEKIGARFLHESPSSIKGRLIPVFELHTK